MAFAIIEDCGDSHDFSAWQRIGRPSRDGSTNSADASPSCLEAL
jgi:hypothetical protein